MDVPNGQRVFQSMSASSQRAFACQQGEPSYVPNLIFTWDRADGPAAGEGI